MTRIVHKPVEMFYTREQLKKILEKQDTDKDGKVNFNEFFHGLFDLVRNYDEEGHNSSHSSDDSMETPAKRLFSQLDKDGDRYLYELLMFSIMVKLRTSLFG